MSKTAIVTGVVLVTMLFSGMWFAGNYNALVSTSLEVDKSWSFVETQYQRRFDLVDNLVQSVKGSQKQEMDVFGKIADARSRYNKASTNDEKVGAVQDMETNIALIPRLQEAYPELKSNVLMQSLMSDLKGTEDSILKTRDNYNTVANNYNKGVVRFPTNIFAKLFNFNKRELFKSSSGAENKVEVKF